MLEVQKNSPTLQLGESYLTDEACAVLAKYLEYHDTFSVLDLHGNNITGNGVLHLSRFLSKSTTLRELSLEWNSLGASVHGLEILCSALAENVSIASLDLRNNCITEAGAQALATLVRANTSLQKIDLRWNEIGTEGARVIIAALERNKFITDFEVSGNKISEDAMNVIEELVERNRLGVKGGNFFKESARSQLNLPIDEQDSFLNEKEKEIMAIKTKYDAQVIAHENTERKLEDAEKNLGKEREKSSQLRQELLKGIDVEKEQNERILNEMNRLKEEFMKNEIKYTKQAQEAELQAVNLENERISLIVEHFAYL
eukprot:TRINITY_DN20605_c0_g1_i2.p1 TRINITY_DN20605_c0_g1~~TRINITY_DN20605_c0_g1_i2.p1  ORF type:complete len:315 (+),score=98.16 TRINITY_DN20605_c0_g1_i2:160-1104(+)